VADLFPLGRRQRNRAVTADTALRLARYFGTSARFWLHVQAQYDLDVQSDLLGVSGRMTLAVPLVCDLRFPGPDGGRGRTATAVSGRVQRRQAERADRDAQIYAEQERCTTSRQARGHGHPDRRMRIARQLTQ